MNNIIDYIRWRGDVVFEYSPVNEVDVALFAELVVPDFSGIIPAGNGQSISIGSAVEKYFLFHKDAGSELGILEPQNTIPMIREMGISRRFRDLPVSGYEILVNEQKTEQFGALTVTLPDGMKCVVFKPTDDTIIGWKEDCMLAVSDRLPAQEDALRYLSEVAGFGDAPLIVAGQSKGGNLAAYAAIHAPSDIQRRICAVYNLDGPGFDRPLDEISAYREIGNRIFTIRSQHSTIGTLMNIPGIIVTVTSVVSGPQAHDPFTWEVLSTGFVRDPKGQSTQSRKFEMAIRETLDGMDDAERIGFIEELFAVLSVGGGRTLSDLKNINLSKITAMSRMLREGSELQAFFNKVLSIYMLPEGVKKILDKTRNGREQEE